MSEQPGSNRPAWKSESTHPDLTERLKEKLTEVIDPEIGHNVLQLGLIRDVTITDEQTTVRMILTTPFCPYGPSMLESVRQKTEEALTRPASIDLGMEMWDFSMMEEGLGGEWGLY
jgi:metal-sulfur cluster biosynthetic enzyme